MSAIPAPRPKARFFIRQHRVRTWLLLLATACMLPLLLFAAVLLLHNAGTDTQEVERQVRDRARLLAEDIDRELARVISVAEVLAISESLVEGNLAGFYRHAGQVRDLIGTNVVIRDLSGQQLVNTRVPWGTELPQNPAFEVDRRVIETRQPQISDLITGALTRAPLLIVVVPVIHDAEVRYLLSLTISTERLQTIISSERLPTGWVAGVADRDGTIIARSFRAEQFIGTPIPAARWAEIRDGPEGVARTVNLDSAMALQAYGRSQLSGWLVGVNVPERLLAAPLRRTMLFFAAGGLLLVLISLGLAVTLGRRLARPIMQLAGAAEALGAGHPVPMPAPGVAEVDAVGRALHDAADLIQRRTAALQESEARLRRVVEGAPFPVMVHAEDGEVVHLSRAWMEMTGYKPTDIPTVTDWARLAYGEPGKTIASDIDRLFALDRPFDEGEHTILTKDGRTCTWSFRSAPIGRDGRGRRLVVSMAADLTERMKAEARQRLLMREVDHRAKNALAVVQSIVLLSRAENPADFAQAVQGRVAAMARAHTLLAAAHWSGISLADMVRNELEAHNTDRRVSIAGPSVAIVANAAQPVSIVLHELTTNAAKYGALSTPRGRLKVSWSIDSTTDRLILDWLESGGPPVKPPTRRGFGSLVIERIVRDQLSGDFINDWAPSGLRCRLVLPDTCFVTNGVSAGAPAALPEPEQDESARSEPGARVLVVEDEALTATAMAQALEAAGYQVLGPVGHVQEAIDLARRTPPDAAVLDVNLFGQPSFAVATTLHAMGVPFLFCTGYGEFLNGPEEPLNQAPVLSKPVTPDHLRNGIAALLDADIRPVAGAARVS